MPARHLSRPAVRLAIVPAATVCAAGEPISVRVTATGRHDVGIRSGRTAMIARIWYRHPEPAGLYVMGANNSRPAPPPATVTGPAKSLNMPPTLSAGSTVQREVTVQNWARAPSGALGILKVDYRLLTQLSLADGASVSAEVPVRIESRRSLNQDVEGAPLAYRHHQVETWPVRYRGDWDLTISLSALYARPGERLRGVLRVSPHQPARARRIQVSLQRIEVLAGSPVPPTLSDAEAFSDVEAPIVTTKRARLMTLATRTGLSGPREFPFAVDVPGWACPTIRTRPLTVRWYVRGWVQDAALQWQVRDAEVNVYTARD
jgi:hypothetical protein